MSKDKYQKATIEAAEGGWIVTVKGKTPKLCFQWRSVINILEAELTSKGDKE